MAWLQLHIETNAEQAVTLGDAMERAGALSIALQDNADQPLFEPAVGETPLWRATRLTGLFPAERSATAILAALNEAFEQPLPPYSFEPLAEQDWRRSGLDNFIPLCFGERLWICPSWHTPPDTRAVNIELDPGLAFGTGSHPTTALCLEWLAEAELQDKCVVDYGCGSGVLAIAALLLGATRVICVDNDPQALLATQRNAERNGIANGRIEVYSPQQYAKKNIQHPLRADLLLANILAAPLITLAPILRDSLAANGELLLSGILLEQAEVVMQAYRPGINFSPPQARDNWVRLTGRVAQR